MNYGSRNIASVAIKMALTSSREEEQKAKEKYLNLGIKFKIANIH